MQQNRLRRRAAAHPFAAETLERRTLFTTVIGFGATPPTPNPPDLEIGSDSGASQTDNVTNAASPVFDASGVLAGATVELLRNGVSVASRTGAGALTDTSAPEGSFNYTVQQTFSGTTSLASTALVVTIDRTIATPGAPDLETASDHGVSTTDNITNVNTPTFDTTTNIEAGQTNVQLLRSGTPIAGRTGAGAITATSAPDGTYSFALRQTDLAGNSASSGSLSVSIDTLPPTLLGGAPSWSYLTVQRLTYSFSENVQPSLTAGDLVVQRITAPAGAIADASKTVNYNMFTNTATLTFTTVPLADGNYNASIAVGGITDVAGNTVSAGSLDFFTFAGDANADRTVDVGDLGALATNYGITTGGSWDKGDFNYDGKVDVGDLGALATNYGKTLAAGTATTASSSSAPTSNVFAAQPPIAAPAADFADPLIQPVRRLLD
jgi:hypothetical protein